MGPKTLWGSQEGPKGKKRKEGFQKSPLKDNGPSQDQQKVQWPQDMSKLRGIEVDHVPIIEVMVPEGKEEFIELVIKVGQQFHVMTQAHFLRKVEVWIDEVNNCELRLYPADLFPRWRLSVRRRPNMQVTVKAECNLHGIWANRVVI